MSKPGPGPEGRSSDRQPSKVQSEQTGRWSSVGISDLGNHRSVNEDALLQLPQQDLWLVADGMGGHLAGDVASQMIVDTLAEFRRGDTLSRMAWDLEEQLLAINRRLRELAASANFPTTIGSTVALMAVLGPIALLIWAGDSRIYRMRDGELKQLTQDHSQVAEMVAQGILPYEMAEEHPASNVITRAVGALDELHLDMDWCDVRPQDRFLLCTDGLTHELPANEIARVMNAGGTLAEQARRLIDLTLAMDAHDNVTLVLVEALEP